MQSFKLKRKAGLPKPKLSLFEEEVQEELDPAVDWLTAAKRPKVFLLEDKVSKAKRLCEEGVTLAQEERWWEAINRWIGAQGLVPNDCKTHDMLAQAYLKVGEVYPAVSSATKATELDPQWWPGHQTLGRAQLGIGEVRMAIKSFSRAIHISPHETELWKEDLEWAVSLRKKQTELKEEENIKKQKFHEENSFILEEIKEGKNPLPEIMEEKSDPPDIGVDSSSMTVELSSRNSVNCNAQNEKIMNTSMILYRR